jgi:hypothetical protein
MVRCLGIVLTVSLVVVLALGSPPLFADSARGVATYVEGLDAELKVGRQILVVIGIDQYQQWLPLHSPVKDVKDIEEILQDRYYIDEVFELYDSQATKANIIKLFVDLQEKMHIEDSLLIVYSGHGHLDQNSNTGFWIPVNAGTDIYEQHNWLPHTQLKGLITNIPASHICVISDSCFAGDLIYNTRSIPPTIDAEYFRRAYSRVSRQVLTSGSTEIVPDDSEFADQLKFILARNENRFLDILMLYNEVRLGVESSIPLLGALGGTGHQEGASFVLFLREDAEIGAMPYGPVPAEPGASLSAAGEPPRSYLTTGVSAGGVFPLADMASVMNVGLSARTQLHSNRTKGGGAVGFGLSTGLIHVHADFIDQPDYTMRCVPIGVSMRYTAFLQSPLFWSVDLGGGIMINSINFDSDYNEDLTTIKGFLSPTLNLGMRFLERWGASVYGSYLLILFDNNCFTGIAAGLGVEYAF